MLRCSAVFAWAVADPSDEASCAAVVPARWPGPQRPDRLLAGLRSTRCSSRSVITGFDRRDAVLSRAPCAEIKRQSPDTSVRRKPLCRHFWGPAENPADTTAKSEVCRAKDRSIISASSCSTTAPRLSSTNLKSHHHLQPGLRGRQRLCPRRIDRPASQPHPPSGHAGRGVPRHVGHAGSGQPWTAVVKNRRKTGDHYWVRANVTPVVEDGHIVGYMSVRTKPGRDEVAAAEALYARMRDEAAASRIVTTLQAGEVVGGTPAARLARWLHPATRPRSPAAAAAALLAVSGGVVAGQPGRHARRQDRGRGLAAWSLRAGDRAASACHRVPTGSPRAICCRRDIAVARPDQVGRLMKRPRPAQRQPAGDRRRRCAARWRA